MNIFQARGFSTVSLGGFASVTMMRINKARVSSHHSIYKYETFTDFTILKPKGELT